MTTSSMSIKIRPRKASGLLFQKWRAKTICLLAWHQNSLLPSKKWKLRTPCAIKVRPEGATQIMTYRVPLWDREVVQRRYWEVKNRRSRHLLCNNYRCQACSSGLTPGSFLLKTLVRICKERKRWLQPLRVRRQKTIRTRGCRTCHPVCFLPSWIDRQITGVLLLMNPSALKTTWKKLTRAGTPPRSFRGCWRGRVTTGPLPCTAKTALGPGFWTSQHMTWICCLRDKSCCVRGLRITRYSRLSAT